MDQRRLPALLTSCWWEKRLFCRYSLHLASDHSCAGAAAAMTWLGLIVLLVLAAAAAAAATAMTTTTSRPSSEESSLPVCPSHAVCSKVDLYEPSSPWLERQCRCPHGACPDSLNTSDGHTLRDRTRLYKMCEPVRRLPRCRYFRDATWSLLVTPGGQTHQLVHCACPRGSVVYLLRRKTSAGGHEYSFACSPQSRLRCLRKEPCRLFTARKRPERRDEVTPSTLCQCPATHACPQHHAAPGVVAGAASASGVRTYSAYCTPS